MKPIMSLLLGSVLLAISQLTAWAVVTPQGFQLGNPETLEIPTTRSISQHGISWTFADDETCGTFVNGDPWCTSPVSIIDITPGVITLDRVTNGSDVNPTTPFGYDAHGASMYSAAENVGIGVSAGKPLVLTGDVSLVSTIGNTTFPNSWVKTAAVLTVLSTPPPAGTFRPGISAATKTLHNISSINFSLLKRLAVPPGITINESTFTKYAAYFQMVFLDHTESAFYGTYLHPSDSGMDKYYFPWQFAEAALMLNMDFSDAVKNDLLINFIQIGIDLYSFLESGGKGWPPDGGNANGRKWPILFAGIMLDYAPMKNIGLVSGDYLDSGVYGAGNPPPDYKHFGEDGQTFYVAQKDVDITNGLTWRPDTRTAPNYPYTTAMIGMPEWGIRYATAPYLSDASWKANYRSIRTGGPIWSGTTLAARIMGVKSLWNHDALFDYVDRYMAISKGHPDPFGFVVPGEGLSNGPTPIVDAMWAMYRVRY